MSEGNALRQLQVDRLNKSFEGASAFVLLEHVLTFEFKKSEIALVSSFGTESAILLHMISQIDAKTDVVFMDTLKLFKLTQKYREQLTDLFKLENVKIFQPDPKELAEHDPQENLWFKDSDKCCEIRKVNTNNRVMKPYMSTITGRKRSHGGSRMRIEKFEFVDGVVKINPLANWKMQDINHYFEANNIPRHPLYERGFLSVGCHHCSEPTTDLNDPRSGRWKGKDKTECGIHMPKLDTTP